jgi:hypothetical protein
MTDRPGEAPMSIATALVRVGYLFDRYAGCDSRVLRVISHADEDAIKVLADAIRGCEWCPVGHTGGRR